MKRQQMSDEEKNGRKLVKELDKQFLFAEKVLKGIYRYLDGDPSDRVYEDQIHQLLRRLDGLNSTFFALLVDRKPVTQIFKEGRWRA